MKNPPTLADACIATALNKHLQSREVRDHFLKIATARKLVLDQNMSAYLADLSQSFRGGLRNRIRMLENVRQMARLPHRLMWIEFDYSAYAERLQQVHRVTFTGPGPRRAGWLLQQHDVIETAFMATEVTPSIFKPGWANAHPFSAVWRCDDDPLPWRTITTPSDELTSEAVTMQGYRTKQIALTFTYTPQLSKAFLAQIKGSIEPELPIRDLWVLLATLNDLPVLYEHVTPSHGYVARGSYKRFLGHSIVHLTVPETRWRSLVRKTAALVRRRAHQVRGHFRKDRWRPLRDGCDHVFDAEMVCRGCGGHKIWVAEHQRGDASIGFVTHDYSVHAEGTAKARQGET